MRYRVLRYEGNLSEFGGPSGDDCWSDLGWSDGETEVEALNAALANEGREAPKPGRYVTVPEDGWREHKAERTVEIT
jgi:hypothetical protein